MQIHIVDTLNVRIEAMTVGHGPWVVLLPSLGRGVDDLCSLAEILAAQGFSVCLPNPRGIGGSSGSLTHISLDDLADDVINVMHHIGCNKAWIAGHAFGNWVARNIATRYPTRVSGIALIAAAHKNFPTSLRNQIDICMNSKLSDEDRIASLQSAFFAAGNDPTSWLTGWFPDVAKAQRDAAKASPQINWWKAGSAQILDLQASDDPFAPESTCHELQLELGLDRVQVVRISNASHALIPEQPIAVANALIQFFTHQTEVT
jgi:pimeloyl-ACP methyl ester carboxylesterase